MILADYHLHTSFSSDSESPMEEMIRHAVSLGLKTICFTEHHFSLTVLLYISDPVQYQDSGYLS